VKSVARARLWSPPRSAFAGFRFPVEVIVVAVRWYLRYGLSYRDVEELLAARGIQVDHVTAYRWVQRFTPLLADAARFTRHSPRRPVVLQPCTGHAEVTPTEVATDAAPVYPAVLEELVPAAWQHVEQYANNPIEADHGRLKHRLRPMRGLRTGRAVQVVITGHVLVQNLRRGHYELAVEIPPTLRVAAAFTELPTRSDTAPAEPNLSHYRVTQQRRPRIQGALFRRRPPAAECLPRRRDLAGTVQCQQKRIGADLGQRPERGSGLANHHLTDQRAIRVGGQRVMKVPHRRPFAGVNRRPQAR
jgi:transposase-like protein